MLQKPLQHLRILFLCFAALLVENQAYSQRFQSIQDQRAAVITGGYQFLSEEFIQVGIGFQPRKKLLKVARINYQRSFNGYVFSASKSTRSTDWGLDVGYQLSAATFSGPLAGGISATYRQISHHPTFGFTPKIGLSIPFVDLTYSYFWQLSESSLSHSQHQLSLLFFVRFWHNFE